MPTNVKRRRGVRSASTGSRLRHAKKTDLDRIHGGITGRLWRAIDGRYTFRGISDTTGFSHESVRRWFQGINTVAVVFVAPFCRATGVSIEWLVTGRGAMKQKK
ncbi:MAG: hypothetical protein ACREJO_15605 [Phycisphaerales bacterium]